MATTKLNKNITKETDVRMEGKPLLVTLTKDNKIVIKQKGEGKNLLEVEISIADLFGQLLNGSGILDEGKAMVNLNDFRSQYLLNSSIDTSTKGILERITVALIKRE